MRYATILSLVFMSQSASASFQDGTVLQRVSLVNQKDCSHKISKTDKETNLVSEETSSRKVFFETNSASLDLQSKNILRELASQMNSNDLTKIQVIGYADSRGDTHSNQKLSQQRARAVMNILKAQGLPVTKMDVMGGGEKNSENHADARIVEIQVIR